MVFIVIITIIAVTDIISHSVKNTSPSFAQKAASASLAGIFYDIIQTQKPCFLQLATLRMEWHWLFIDSDVFK